MALTVYRQPPSFYRLDAIKKSRKAIDYIAFVKIKNELRCFQTKVELPYIQFPFELPSATWITCKVVLCACQQKDTDRHNWVSTTTAHSGIITFKTCRFV